MSKQDKVFGKKSIFGQMPDWNPVEMIGRSPKKLAISLYKYLITDQVWREARSEMGYKFRRNAFNDYPFRSPVW